MTIEARNKVASAAGNGKHGHSLISDAKFRQLYEIALKLQLRAQRKNGDGSNWVHGREAVLAGVAADLRAGDGVVAGVTREHVAPFAEVVGVAILNRRSFEERVICALSDAMADRMRKTGRVSVILSDGVQAAETLKEARALASAAKLPVLFVEDGGTAEQKPVSSTRGKRAAAARNEYPTIPVDTQDVIAMYRVAHESIARAREGGGPTHIVGVRWQLAASGGERCGAKRETGSEDAVEHLEHWLRARGLPAQEWRRAIAAEFEATSREQSFSAPNAANTRCDDTETRAIA